MVLSVCLCPKSRPGGSVWTVMLLSVCLCPRTRPGGSVWTVSLCVCLSRNSTGGVGSGERSSSFNTIHTTTLNYSHTPLLLSVCVCPKTRPGGSVWTVMLLSVCVCPKTRPGGSVWTVMLLSVCVCPKTVYHKASTFFLLLSRVDR